MQETRAIAYKREWIILGVALLLALAVWFLLKGPRNSVGAHNPSPDSAAASTSLQLSPADLARRAAIAALGPIETRKGTNAASLYTQASALYAQLTDAEKQILDQWRDKPDPQTAAALYSKIQPIMDLLRRARKADYADWSLDDWWKNPAAATPELNAIRYLSFLAAWDSNYRFQSDPQGAINDLAAMDALGRNANPSAIGLLLGNSVYSAGIYILAQNAAAIPATQNSYLDEILNPTLIQQNFQRDLNGEAASLQSWFDSYSDPSTRSQAMAVYGTGSHKFMPEDMVSGLKWMAQTDQALAVSLSEPDAQYQQWLSQAQAQSASNPYLSALGALRSIAATRDNTQALLVENTMLSAGIALEQNNQPQFQSITDPATGHPFTYTQTPTGFQLTSAFKRNGKPVSLTFTTPAPQ